MVLVTELKGTQKKTEYETNEKRTSKQIENAYASTHIQIRARIRIQIAI